MKVAFHSRLLTERGSEGAMLDYARMNVEILGNESLLCIPDKPSNAENPIFLKWQNEFPCVLYKTKFDLARKLKEKGTEVIYHTKPGPFDGFVVPGIKNCVHAQFLCDEFHGDVYAYVSPWLSLKMTGAEESCVPLWVPRYVAKNNLRKALHIPPTSRVFGRHGGWDTFNIPFVREEVRRYAQRNPRDHFLFLNTKPIPGTENLGNVHYLPATIDPAEKAAFLATCDVMLHGRWHGETFGLAVGEFAVLGKPVITFGGSRERAHLDMLQDSALVYGDRRDLIRIFKTFEPGRGSGGAYTLFSSRENIAKKFSQKFLN